jgi:hypothetical protein
MQKLLERSLKLGLVLLVGSIGLTACPSTDTSPLPPPPAITDISAGGGLVQMAGWGTLLKGAFQFVGSGVANLNNGLIDSGGTFTFKLPTTYPAASGLLKVSNVIGTGCTTTPTDSIGAFASLFLQNQNENQAHGAVIIKSPANDGLLHVNDEVVQFWIFAPKAFTVTGAKGCSTLSPRVSADASFKPGWNYLVEQFVGVSPDGKTILEGKLKVLSTLPPQFQWFENTISPASTPLNPMTRTLLEPFLLNQNQNFR